VGPIRGDDLASHVADQLESNTRAVYLWRRCLRAEPEAAVSDAKFREWIRNTISRPYVSTGELRLRAHQALRPATVRSDFVRLKGVEIGGGEHAMEALAQADLEPESPNVLRRWYVVLQHAALEYGPVLYVGESSDLGQRIRDHLGGSTPLLGRLEALGLSLAGVSVSYLPLPDWDEKERRLFEKILTHLLVAPLTIRPG